MQETKENCEMETGKWSDTTNYIISVDNRHITCIFVDVTDGEQMPKLLPLEVSIPNYKPRKSVHERLGKRRVGDSESECESIHTSRLALYRPKFKNHISNRLQKNYMSEAMVQRNKIAITALHEYATEAMKHLKATDVEQGRLLVNSFANTFEALDNDVEVSISWINFFNFFLKLFFHLVQGRKLQWDSSNTQAVSVDGPGIKFVKVRPDTSNMSLNQRFT